MARCLQRSEDHAAEIDLVAFGHPPVREAVVPAARRRDGGSGCRPDLQGPGDVVVVHVGLDHIPDGETASFCGCEEPPRVALGVHKRGLVADSHQIGVVAQRGGDEDVDLGPHLGPRLVIACSQGVPGKISS